MANEFLTVKQVAEALEITEQTVRNYISKGILKSEKFFNSTVIKKDEVKRYRDERQVMR